MYIDKHAYREYPEKCSYYDFVGLRRGRNDHHLYCCYPGCRRHISDHDTSGSIVRKGFGIFGGKLYCDLHYGWLVNHYDDWE